MSEPETKHVLVVANETLAGEELLDAVRLRAGQGPIRAVVIAPVNEPSAGYVVYRNSRRATAGRRVDRMVAASDVGWSRVRSRVAVRKSS